MKYVWIAVVVIIAIIAVVFVVNSRAKHVNVIAPSGVELELEVAKTLKERQRGLSRRHDIGDGMLFCMDGIGPHRFWMENMRVEIDAIGLVDDEVVWMEEGIVTGTKDEPTTFRPEGGQIIELPVGDVFTHKIEIGSVIEGVQDVCI